MRYDIVSDIFLLLVVLCVIIAIFAIKRRKKETSHVRVSGETFSATRQYQHITDLKSSGISLVKTILKWIVLIAIGGFFWVTVGSLIVSILI